MFDRRHGCRRPLHVVSTAAGPVQSPARVRCRLLVRSLGPNNVAPCALTVDPRRASSGELRVFGARPVQPALVKRAIHRGRAGQHEIRRSTMGDLAGLLCLKHLDASARKAAVHGLADGRVLPEEQGACVPGSVTWPAERAKAVRQVSKPPPDEPITARRCGNGVAD